jgi:hypothetical protein
MEGMASLYGCAPVGVGKVFSLGARDGRVGGYGIFLHHVQATAVVEHGLPVRGSERRTDADASFLGTWAIRPGASTVTGVFCRRR